jgi:hypothetical protein
MVARSLRFIWKTIDRNMPAFLTGSILCLVGYAVDIGLDKLGISIAATILNNLIIGVLGAMLLTFYLAENGRKHELVKARERMALVGELNRDIRQALILIGYSASLDDRSERLQRVDEAMEQIETVLTELLPSGGSGNSRG